MKHCKSPLSSILALLLAAASPAQAADPCSVTLCLWGKLQGVNPAECSAPLQVYFAIKVPDPVTGINWPATAAARAAMLAACPGSDPASQAALSARFGMALG